MRITVGEREQDDDARAAMGARGTWGNVGYAWCARESLYHVARDARMRLKARPFDCTREREPEHFPFSRTLRQIGGARDVRIARIGEHVGTYATLHKMDHNARDRRIALGFV